MTDGQSIAVDALNNVNKVNNEKESDNMVKKMKNKGI